VTIDPRVLYGVMKEICPEFDVSKKKFTREIRETHWKNTFDFERLKASKQKIFTGMIETDGEAIFVDYRRSKADRPVLSSASPLT